MLIHKRKESDAFIGSPDVKNYKLKPGEKPQYGFKTKHYPISQIVFFDNISLIMRDNTVDYWQVILHFVLVFSNLSILDIPIFRRVSKQWYYIIGYRLNYHWRKIYEKLQLTCPNYLPTVNSIKNENHNEISYLDTLIHIFSIGMNDKTIAILLTEPYYDPKIDFLFNKITDSITVGIVNTSKTYRNFFRRDREPLRFTINFGSKKHENLNTFTNFDCIQYTDCNHNWFIEWKIANYTVRDILKLIIEKYID